MTTDIVNIALSFLEGMALIASPCILPILPILLAGSIEGSKKRPIGIIVGFILAFAFFTFFSRAIVRYSGIDLTLVRYVSYALLFILGMVMLSTYLSGLFAYLTRRLTHVGMSSSITRQDFISGVFFGALVGLIWTPCAGPILAAVIVQTIIQKTTFNSFLIVLAFGIGAAVPMLLIVFFGRTIISAVSFFREHAEGFRKMLGCVVIASVIYMVYGEGLTFSFGKPMTGSIKQNNLIGGLYTPYPAPSLEGITEWINSSPLQLKELKGKVILIDFWTYSCINCVRTLPYLKDWYSKYHQKGFEIIGVHSPEFDFEKKPENVKAAVEKFGLRYPVALDNYFLTWQNYHNRYWPAHYLIDKNGNIVYQHFGEGEYDTTENNIRFLLGLNAIVSSNDETSEISNGTRTPETYLGYARMAHYASPESIVNNSVAVYSFPKKLAVDAWALQGSWIISPQRIVSAEANAALKIHFNARAVFVVMGNATGLPIHVKVRLNDKPITNEKGKNVEDSAILVNKYDLYEVVNLSHSSTGILQLNASAPGLEVYTFTFG